MFVCIVFSCYLYVITWYFYMFAYKNTMLVKDR